MSPAITAPEVASTRPSWGTICRNWRTFTAGLESSRIVFQAIVRIRYVVKNGATTANSSRLFHLPARREFFTSFHSISQVLSTRPS